MKIGIITDRVDEQQRVGHGVYILNLIRGLNLIDKQNEYYLIHPEALELDIYKQNTEILVPYPRINFKGRWHIWRTTILPLKVRGLELDLLHDPCALTLIFCMPFKRIVTVHDIGVILTKHHHWVDKMCYKVLLPRVVKNVDHIITISNFSKQQMIKYLNVPGQKITVIYHGIDAKYKVLPQHEVSKVKRKYSFDFPFILYVGALTKRKNIPALINAYYHLKKERMEHKLVIVGKTTLGSDEILERVKEMQLQNEVLFPGYVPDEDLPAMYNAAALFVFPSLFEGFGFPPLEAMACGTPVISSNTTSLPEIVGDAGIMVSPNDITELTRAMYEVLTNNDLRRSLIDKGLNRVKMFSWENTVSETLKVYQDVMET